MKVQKNREKRYKNKYFKRARISEYKTRLLIKYFSLDLEVTKMAKLLNLNRKTVNYYAIKIRKKLATHSETISKFNGEVELDESYFGGRYKNDKRGRGTPNKVPVFGILKRNGKVYTQVIKNASKREIMPVIQGKIDKEATLYTDKWKAYDGLVFNGYEHKRINHSKEMVDSRDKRNHINGIENFWGWCKNRLKKFNGIRRDNFYLHIKESEFRFNYRNNNLYAKILEVLRHS